MDSYVWRVRKGWFPNQEPSRVQIARSTMAQKMVSTHGLQASLSSGSALRETGVLSEQAGGEEIGRP